MNYLLDPCDPKNAPLLNLLKCGADIREDSEDRLVIELNGLFAAAGRADRSDLFRGALMALCTEEEPAKKMFAEGCFESMFACTQYAYLCDPFDVRAPEGVTLRRLTEADVPFLCEHYHHPSATPRHMRERVAVCMIGAFIDGKCAGFAGIHEEDAIGMLEVLPEYRGRGIAKALTGELINYQLSRGHIPYTQVRLGNTVSMHLQESLGFTAAKSPVCWLCKDSLYTKSKLR